MTLHLLLFYPSIWYLCDFFLFHIEIEGKAGWFIGGGGGGGGGGGRGVKGYVGPPSQIIGGGGRCPHRPPSSHACVLCLKALIASAETTFINTFSLFFRENKT